VVEPTAVDDANPLEGDYPDGGMVVLLVALEMMLIEQLGPEAETDGVRGEFVERLADKLGTGAAHGDTAGVSAADEDWGNAGETVEIAGIAPVIAIGSEGGDEARHQGGSCPWQRAEDGRVGVIGGNGSDALVIGGDLISQDTELSQAGGSPAAAGFQNDLVAGGRMAA